MLEIKNTITKSFKCLCYLIIRLKTKGKKSVSLKKCQQKLPKLKCKEKKNTKNRTENPRSGEQLPIKG